MKFSCEKYQLSSIISIVSRAAAVKSAVPALEGVLIEADENVMISGFDLKTGIRAELKADVYEKGVIVLNAKLFGDIIRKLPDDIVTITVDENYMMTITCQMSTFNIMCLSPEDYPDLPSVDSTKSIYIPENVIKSMIRETNFAVSDNEARPIHMGELFEVEGGMLTMVAVDGYRLALRREPITKTEIENGSFVVPGAALSEVEKIASESDELVRIVPGEKHILFEIGSIILVCRRLEGEFLNYKNSIPKAGKYSIDVDTRTFMNSVERVSLIISDKLKSPIRCVFEEGLLKISTSTPLGRAYDECVVDGDGEGLEIGFNNKYVSDALKAVPADTVRLQLSTGISPCVIIPADGNKNFIYMILPVRLRANEG